MTRCTKHGAKRDLNLVYEIWNSFSLNLIHLGTNNSAVILTGLWRCKLERFVDVSDAIEHRKFNPNKAFQFDFSIDFYDWQVVELLASSSQLQQIKHYLWILFSSDAELCHSLSTCCIEEKYQKKVQCSLLDSWGTLHCQRKCGITTLPPTGLRDFSLGLN